MIFSELYSAYYNAVACILREALRGPVTPEKMRRIISENAFDERRLARAILADDAEDLAAPQRKRQVLQDLMLAVRLAKRVDGENFGRMDVVVLHEIKYVRTKARA